MSKETIEEIRFEFVKNVLVEFPELRERLREHLREENDKKRVTS